MKATLKTVIVGLLVIVFFGGIILLYYNRLYEERRSNITKDVEMTAVEQADQLEAYLSTNIDLINYSAYALDEMIREGQTDAEIQSYLVAQSTVVKNAILEDSTGLYGYINGKFFSGTNWVPPEGYDATIRPWYIKPMESVGEVSILEPYHDVQSGHDMLALGKVLCDGVSVVSVDISIDQMQELTEDTIKHKGFDSEMILTGTGIVVAHSDRREVGKDYSKEDGTLGAKIFKYVSDSSERCFEIEDNGSQYIVFAEDFEDDWHCISVHDATQALGELRRLFLLTMAMVVATVIIIGLIMGISRHRSILAEKAVAASEAKSVFLSSMSHEIRTPINVMMGMNEMILRECDDDKILKYSESVKMAGLTLLGLINDVLDFSRIESGKMEIIPADYDLSSLLNDVVNMISKMAEDKGLEFKLDFDRNTPRLLVGDEVRIKQVMSNILTNAVKYTHEGYVRFCVGFKKDGSDEDSVILKVSVRDTGIGIKDENLSKLFTEFERIDEERNRNIEGSGLGMNITLRLLELMGSTLNVESVYGVGSEFSFELKQKVRGSEVLGDYEESYKKALDDYAGYRKKFEAPKAKLLVVDDNQMNQVVIEELLKHTHARIVTADNGTEGLAYAGMNRYDIIFLDQMLPDKNGTEVMRQIRDNRKGPNVYTPVICLTANAISGAKEQYISEGFDDYLSKPVDPDKLEDMLIRYLPDKKIVWIKDTDAHHEEDDTSGSPSVLKTLEGRDDIDINIGMKNGRNTDSYIKLLEVFDKSLDEKTKALNRHLKEKDLKSYTISVHALKSSARTIGAVMLGEEAFRLEEAGRNEDIGYIMENHEAFLQSCSVIGGLVKRVLEDNERASAKRKEKHNMQEADKAVMEEAYARLRTAAGDLDCDRLNDIITAMDAYKIPESQISMWKEITEAVAQFDYDEVLRLLDGLQDITFDAQNDKMPCNNK